MGLNGGSLLGDLDVENRLLIPTPCLVPRENYTSENGEGVWTWLCTSM